MGSEQHKNPIYYSNSSPAHHQVSSGGGIIMPYGTVNSYFHSPSRWNRRSKQTQSWDHGQSESIHDILPRRPRVSINLFSIISKFEALDAISLPFKIRELQPAPLQLSRDSSRRQAGTRTNQIKKLSTFFSLRDKSTDSQKGLGSIDEFALGREDFLGAQVSIGANLTVSRHGKSKLGKPQSSSKDSPLRLRETFKAFPYQDEGNRDTVLQEKSEGGSKRRRTIKDIIKFYDGSMNAHFPSLNEIY